MDFQDPGQPLVHCPDPREPIVIIHEGQNEYHPPDYAKLPVLKIRPDDFLFDPPNEPFGPRTPSGPQPWHTPVTPFLPEPPSPPVSPPATNFHLNHYLIRQTTFRPKITTVASRPQPMPILPKPDTKNGLLANSTIKQAPISALIQPATPPASTKTSVNNPPSQPAPFPTSSRPLDNLSEKPDSTTYTLPNPRIIVMFPGRPNTPTPFYALPYSFICSQPNIILPLPTTNILHSIRTLQLPPIPGYRPSPSDQLRRRASMSQAVKDAVYAIRYRRNNKQ